jgi:thiamine kinase-like enzyme
MEEFGSGHINDTYRVKAGGKFYILQRVNHTVFKNIDGLTENIKKISAYIASHNKNHNMQFLHFYSDQDGKQIVEDDIGNYWRLMDYIANTKSFDIVENEKVAYSGGEAYGWFVKVLKDFPAETLMETIPDFHNIDFRLKNFKKAIKTDVKKRLKEVENEVLFVQQRAEEMRTILLSGQSGKIPLRVTHNDTKISNVLFDNQDNAVCVIDLDTVMPGYVHYDFGDAVRTFTNTAKEDEKDLSKVGIDMRLYHALYDGFLSQTQDVLSSDELSLLPFSAKFMTYIMGVRFLTDYLEGDVYYKTAYLRHNLVRAKNQFRLLESMEQLLN